MKRFAVGLIAMLVLAVVPTTLAQKVRRPASQPAEKPQPPAAEESKEPKAEAARRTLPEPAEWAPADALVYLGINDVGDAWQDLQKTSAYSLLSEAGAPGAPPGLSALGAPLAELKARLAKALGVPPDQLQNPLAGPVALFITAPFGAKAEEIEPGLVAGVGDAALMKKYYDAAVAKLKTLGKHEAVTVGSDTIDVFTIERAKQATPGQAEENEFDRLDAGAGAKSAAPDEWLKRIVGPLVAGESLPGQLALCLTADRVVVAGSTEYAQAVLRHDPSIKTLAETDDYKALLQNLKPTGDIRFVVNLPRMLDMAAAAAEGSEAKELRKQIKAYGLDTLGSLVGHCRLGAASYEWKVDALLLLGDKRAGLVKLLSMENRPAAPPADISADTCVYATCNLDVPQWLAEIETRLSPPPAPGAPGPARPWMEMQLSDGQTVNLRQALFDYLNGPLTACFRIGRSPGPPGARFLLSIGQHDQAAVARFLSGPVAQGFLQAREVRGMQIFDLGPLPLLPVPGLSVAVTPDRLVVGSTAAVEGALAPTSTEPLRETDAWKRVARYVPEQASFTLYVDNRKLLDSLLELAKKPPEPTASGPGAPDLGTMILAGLLQSMGGGAPGGDLSGLERLRRYTTQAIYTIATTPQGVQFTAVQVRPEK